MPEAYDALHAPLITVLRHVLPELPAPTGALLDIGCGAGHKWSLLHEACHGARLIGLDADMASVRAAVVQTSDSSYVTLGAHEQFPLLLVADAQRLPLRDATCAAAVCLALIGLLDDAASMLREVRRALAPGGWLLVATAAQRWAPVTRWPPDLAAELRALLAAERPWIDSPDLGGPLAGQLVRAGLALPAVRAFDLAAADDPPGAELPLLPWAALRPLAARRLTPAQLHACDQAAALAEPEIVAALLVARAARPA